MMHHALMCLSRLSEWKLPALLSNRPPSAPNHTVRGVNDPGYKPGFFVNILYNQSLSDARR